MTTRIPIPTENATSRQVSGDGASIPQGVNDCSNIYLSLSGSFDMDESMTISVFDWIFSSEAGFVGCGGGVIAGLLEDEVVGTGTVDES